MRKPRLRASRVAELVAQLGRARSTFVILSASFVISSNSIHIFGQIDGDYLSIIDESSNEPIIMTRTNSRVFK